MILNYCKREVSFLIAKKSLRRPIIGDFARWMKSIGVERPQDIAFAGKGRVIVISETQINGLDT